MTESQLLSIYLDDPHADDWVWEYQEEDDEWHFFADDYEPPVSVKVFRWDGYPTPCVLRSTTMPKGVREVVMRSGLTLFEKSDAGITHVALDKAVVMKMEGLAIFTMTTGEVLAMTERMKT